MTERPILFKGPMVRAILEGKKTQTRRAVNTKRYSCIDWGYASVGDRCHSLAAHAYGKPGDRLWVRETFCIESSREVAYDPPHSDGRPIRHHNDQHWDPWWEQPHYRATDPAPELDVGTGEPGCRWRPSIVMPRWASRITLEITGVRVERLQQISGPDCWEEGISHAGWDPERYGSVVECYRDLWDSINARNRPKLPRNPNSRRYARVKAWLETHPDTTSWDANPWVWVVEFRRLPAGEART